MIIGSFDQEKTALCSEPSFLPRFRLDYEIDFLVDTGADTTTMHPEDAITMNVPYHKLRRGPSAYGIGDVQANFEETAFVVFAEGDKVRVYGIRLSIPEPSPHNMNFPSLLGQDLMGNWRMVHDPSRDILTFTVVTADFSMTTEMDDVDFFRS